MIKVFAFQVNQSLNTITNNQTGLWQTIEIRRFNPTKYKVYFKKDENHND